jgi:hypothetical protein
MSTARRVFVALAYDLPLAATVLWANGGNGHGMLHSVLVTVG